MKIRISDIPADSSLSINADSAVNEWLKKAFVEVLGPDKIKNEDGGRLDLQIFRNDRNLTLIGGVILKFHQNCDRCLSEFQKQEQVPIHQIMIPVREKKNKKKEEIETDDEDFSFYTGDEIDLGDIVKEYIILAQKMVNLCRDNCKGICPKCGKNLNKGPCKCKKSVKKDSPFAVLKKLHA